MKEIFIALISGGFFVFLEFLIKRWDNKHSEISGLRDDIKDVCDISLQNYEANKKSIEEVRKMLIQIEADNQRQSELINSQAKELIGLGHDKIIYITGQIAQRGYITLKEKTNLEALYLPYSCLGGNGDAKTGYNHCMSLPVISEERAQELDRLVKSYNYGVHLRREDIEKINEDDESGI